MTRNRILSFLKQNLPGYAYLNLGRRVFGTYVLILLIIVPLLILMNLSVFFDGLLSFVLSLFLLVTDFGNRNAILRADVIEFWIASVTAIIAPVSLWYINRRRYLKRISEVDEHEMSQWSVAWREFRKHKAANIGLIVILSMYGVAFLCPYLSPYHPNAFQDGVVTQFKPPFSKVTVLHLKKDRIKRTQAGMKNLESTYPKVLRYLIDINNRLTDYGISREIYVDAFHIEVSDVIATKGQDYIKVPVYKLVSSDPEVFSSTRIHVLGTDSYGRDILSRIIYGSRISLSLGFIAVLLSVTLGTIIGLFAGYFGKLVDSSLMRIVDILLAFPSLFLILVIISVFETIPVPRIILIVFVLGLSSWMGIARLIRGEVLSLKQRDFVVAARALGLRHSRIIFRHILPNALTPIIVNATLRIGGIILVEAALSYLNLGVQQPTASWGNIIFEGKDFISRAWWISTFPGFAIVLTVVSFNLIGDGLRDAFDPMLKES